MTTKRQLLDRLCTLCAHQRAPTFAPRLAELREMIGAAVGGSVVLLEDDVALLERVMTGAGPPADAEPVRGAHDYVPPRRKWDRAKHLAYRERTRAQMDGGR